MQNYDIVIIGGGASGLMSAVFAADNKKVLLLEASTKLGKKLLATGNGKCNLTNKNMSINNYHGDTSGINQLLEMYDCDKIRAVFSAFGIKTITDTAGRVYPKSEQSATVVKTLADICEEKNVDCRLGFNVDKINKADGFFHIISKDGDEVFCKKLIIATGGKASPKLNGGDGYALLQQLGHTVTPLNPALTGFTSSEKFLKTLSGVRVKCGVTLLDNGKTLAKSKGELIFNDKAVSGICIFDLSLYAPQNYDSTKICLDLCESMTEHDLVLYLTDLIYSRPKMLCGDLLNGILNMNLGYVIVNSLKIDKLMPVSGLSSEQIKQISKKIKAFNVNVNGLKSWDSTQVTSGGVPLNEINIDSCSSKICPSLFIIGEALNIHGDCGGYNLHWAWLTGIIAGKNANGKVINL